MIWEFIIIGYKFLEKINYYGPFHVTWNQVISKF